MKVSDFFDFCSKLVMSTIQAHYQKSEIIEKRLVPHGPLCKYYKGLVIDDWDGSDFFTPEGTYATFVSKKAADVLKKNKITNLNLENLADYQVHVSDVRQNLSE